MGIFRFPEIRISKCGNAFVLQLVRPNFLVYPTCASQADTGDKFFNFNRKHAVFAHFKIVFKKTIEKNKKIRFKAAFRQAKSTPRPTNPSVAHPG
jgi:hypothetical protein